MSLHTSDQTVTPTPGAYGNALDNTLRKHERGAVILYAREHPLWDILKPNFKSQVGGAGMELRLIMGRAAGPQVTNSDGRFIAVKNGNLTNTALYDFDRVEVSSVRLDWLELERNRGALQLVDMLKTHREAARYEFMRSIVEHMHTVHDDLRPGTYLSLDSITNDAVHEVGGIDYTDPGNAEWRPVTLRFSEAETATVDIKQAFRQWFQQFRIRNGRAPRRVICGLNIWNAILEYLDDRGTLDSIGGNAGDIEWQSVMFDGVQVAWDPDCAPNRAYGLTPEELHLRYLNDNFLKVLPAREVKEVVDVGEGGQSDIRVADTLASVYPIVSVLSVGVRNRRMQGLLIYGQDLPAGVDNLIVGGDENGDG